MGEAFAKGLVMALLIGVFYFVVFIFKLINRKINGKEINKAEEKFNYLNSKYANLVGTKDDKIGREIKEVNIYVPINPTKNWKVYKTVKGNLFKSDEDVLLYEISDSKLEIILENTENQE